VLHCQFRALVELHTKHQQAPLPLQVIYGDPELDQIQVQDWDDEAEEIEVAAEEEELIRIQQEVERICVTPPNDNNRFGGVTTLQDNN
jgi:hypothetical protein